MPVIEPHSKRSPGTDGELAGPPLHTKGRRRFWAEVFNLADK